LPSSDIAQPGPPGRNVTVIADPSVDTKDASLTDRAARLRVAAEQTVVLSKSEQSGQEEAPALFLDHAYLHEAIRDLRSSDSSTDRAEAARTLGIVGSRLTTPHLIAALFDPAPEVRRAAAESLERLGDPDVAIASLESFLVAESEQPITEETVDAPLTASPLESLRIEAEARERAEEQHDLLEYPPGFIDLEALGDNEAALLPIDNALWDIPPLTIADLYSADPGKRASALLEVARSGGEEHFNVITRCFDDPSSDVRNAAALALSELEPPRTAEFFSQAIESASLERCHNIGNAMVDSGLAAEAINDLGRKDREHAYQALCILFVMAKIGVVEPLAQAIEEHESVPVRSATMRILILSGQQDIAEAAVKRRLMI
jgi:HEAT repeat protein